VLREFKISVDKQGDGFTPRSMGRGGIGRGDLAAF
jgi:hypothetical protein